MNARQGSLRIGTSGYQYDHWRGVFYPQGLPRRGWFAHYARHFDTVEINNTFYRLPEAETFDAWREQAPKGFLYSLKFSRYATHIKRLKEPQQPIETFVQRAEHLQRCLGPVLVQLPPRWRVNLERLDAFLAHVPKRYRWALEFRDASWLNDAVYALLERHQVALCQHDMIARHPRRITTGWVYLRYHGDHYSGSYSHQFLAAQARRIADYLAEGLDVYAYFNNDAQGYAVENALALKRYLGQS